MKNICFLVGDLNSAGGTERVTTIVANALSLDNNIFILSINNGMAPFFDVKENIKINCLFDKTISPKKDALKLIMRLRGYLKNNKIQTLIVVDSISCIFSIPASIGLGINHICWEHFGYNISLGSNFRVLARRLASIFSNHIVTLTNLDKNIWISKLNPRSNILAIPNPCPFEITYQVDDKKKNKIVLAVGRLSHEKGFDLLLDAWEITSKKHADWVLHIVGTGAEEQKLFIKSESLRINHKVFFHGLQSDLVPFYKEASIFCLPSRVEGFGLAMIEAQSFGTPVVAFDCEIGPRELIEHRRNGILCQENDVISLSNGLIEMIHSNESVYNDYVKESLKFSEKFSIENIINQWKNII